MTAQGWIPIALSALALFLSIFRNGKTDAAQLTTLTVKLESIQTSLADIKADMRRDDAEKRETRERLITVEESAKSAHKRINTIEGKDTD
jgi:hypothetical protein